MTMLIRNALNWIKFQSLIFEKSLRIFNHRQLHLWSPVVFASYDLEIWKMFKYFNLWWEILLCKVCCFIEHFAFGKLFECPRPIWLMMQNNLQRISNRKGTTTVVPTHACFQCIKNKQRSKIYKPLFAKQTNQTVVEKLGIHKKLYGKVFTAIEDWS